jgi:hypothetical protein
MAAFEQWLAGSPIYAGLFFAAAFASLTALSWVRDRRIAAATALEFQDAGDPVVRTLGLSPE